MRDRAIGPSKLADLKDSQGALKDSACVRFALSKF